MITITKDNRWISFGGHKQKVSELPPDLKAKFVRMGLFDEEVNEVKEKEQSKSQEIKVSKVRSSSHVREKIVYVPVERREYRKSPDTGMDVVAKFVGRSLGRAWVKLIK